ncbi:MAG: hypothetical protein WDZ77_02240 [Candidatus Pacearchaeota archaeon]
MKIIDKLEININKPKHEEEILRNTETIKVDVKTVLSNQEDEIKKLRDREKIIKEIVTKDLMSINRLNSISNSEYFIVIPKMYTKLKKENMRVLFENNGFYKNSVFKYFQEQNFVNLGKTWTPVYIKNRDELKKGFRNFKIFKKFIDSKSSSLIKKDNTRIKQAILNKRDDEAIKPYFFDEKGKLRTNEYLFFDFMIVSSLNLNEENVTIFDKEAKINFVSKILSHEIQDIKLKEIISKSGIKLFLNEIFPLDVRKILTENNDKLLVELKVQSFMDSINKRDLDSVLKNILKEKYKNNYTDEFMRVYNLIKDF